jgi:predicted aldo/keto reductase-like oxidoreductase
VFDVTELPYNVSTGCSAKTARSTSQYAHEHGMGVINMKAFDGNGLVPIWKNIQELVSFDYPAMLRFCLSNPYISTVDAGARYTAEYDLDVATALRPDPMTPAERDALKTEAGKIAGEMHNICRSCMHCTAKFECRRRVDFAHILSALRAIPCSTASARIPPDMPHNTKNLKLRRKPVRVRCLSALCEYRLDTPGLRSRLHLRGEG